MMKEEIEFSEPLQLPLDPRIEVDNIVIDKCKFMDSKMAPLWVVFENVDKESESVIVIFKSGDDLRQDMLTIELLNIMDKLWKGEGLDLMMSVYGCVSTGDGVGMIEIVQNSSTCADICSKSTKFKAQGAMKENAFSKWLMSYNTSTMDYEKAVDNFTKSVAAYCVASYIIGIGDRHNDNIMLKENGCFFHIDFGHILGNYKYVYGLIPRETAPFVFTPIFAYVMGKKGSEKYEEFCNLAVRAYNIIRHQSHLFLSIVSLTIPCKMPELQSVNNIEHMKKALALDMTDEEAGDHFRKLIDRSLSSTMTILNDIIHIWVHK